MVYFGHIKDGKVIPDPGSRLPEGARVRIEPMNAGRDPADDLSAEAVDTGITDMAEQHDHYASGKRLSL